MNEAIDEATIIAWVDGELDGAKTARVAQALAADPELAALADRHRRMKARFAVAFGPIAEESVALPTALLISLAAARSEGQAKTRQASQRWWGLGGAMAASLLVGMFIGHGVGGSGAPGILALPKPVAQALDGQLSGEDGVVRVALSFRDREGHFCRSFAAAGFSGIACRDASDWRLRYASPTSAQKTDYRMAGDDAAQADIVAAMIAGDPLDRTGEEAARKAEWR